MKIGYNIKQQQIVYVGKPISHYYTVLILIIIIIRHVKFFAISNPNVLDSFSLESEELPAIYLFSGDTDGLARYTGPLVETSLTDWILRNVAPAMDELTLQTPSGQQYAAQFFSSRKLKFILFLTEDLEEDIIEEEDEMIFNGGEEDIDVSNTEDVGSKEDYEDFVNEDNDDLDSTVDSNRKNKNQNRNSKHMKRHQSTTNSHSKSQRKQRNAAHRIIDTWEYIAKRYQGKAIFSYMTRKAAITDVLEYFNIDVTKDLPMIAAHAPTTDSRYKSSRLTLLSSASSPLSPDKKLQVLEQFVEGVFLGKIPKILKSERIVTKQRSLVYKTVGNNLLETVAKPDTDVLLLIYTPYHNQGKQLLPWLEMLAKAVQGDSRILITKIDAMVNDIPTTWNVKSYPTLLFFPAKDKQSSSSSSSSSYTITPRSYWDAGYSLQEMFAFIQRESSFERSTLRIATNEQLASLQQDEEIYTKKVEDEDRYERRNEHRIIYENEWFDYLLGEVIFDGQRWHIGLLGFVSIAWIITLLVLLVVYVQNQSVSSKSLNTTNGMKKAKRS
jgi:hypothetical protein